jgi:hypothetical protein
MPSHRDELEMPGQESDNQIEHAHFEIEVHVHSGEKGQSRKLIPPEQIKGVE